MTTDTPRTDDQFPWEAECPRMSNYCDKHLRGYWRNVGSPWHGVIKEAFEIEKELKASQAEVERLKGRMKEAEDLIKGLHDGWKKARDGWKKERKAHLETCKNAQTGIDKLHTENVCLQELIQEFYEWSRRDYPTESEVREIMDRYYNLLDK
ncbi:MAG: hypothetical protein WAN16_11415 [Chthoniobacterales bacterium]